jgi:hypothetical protein
MNSMKTIENEGMITKNLYIPEESSSSGDSPYKGYYKKKKSNHYIDSMNHALCIGILLYPILYIPLKIYNYWEEKKNKVHPL